MPDTPPEARDTVASRAYIGSVAVASPPFQADQATADEFFTKHYAGRLSPRMLALMHKIFAHPGIVKRSFAFDEPDCLVDEDPDRRIARFLRWAVELSARSGIHALDQACLNPRDISCLVVNTCTGYVCPGISTYLIERMGLPYGIRAYDLVGSGCSGAVPNLQVAESQLRSGSSDIVLSVSVEICSATFQLENDLSLILSNALFSDGAGAAVVWERPEGLELVASSSRYIPELRDHIRYVHKKGQLHNRISTQLPQIIKKEVAHVVRKILTQRSLRVNDIRHWALHTGGTKIINEIVRELGLSEAQVSAARAVLSEYGNMSSPTVWFVLRKLLDAGIESGEWCMMVAFGAGLSAHAYLLRKV
jgi:predicted naringenin-chalcone synthase